MPVTVDAYYQFAATSSTIVWNSIGAGAGTWLVVVHGMSGSIISQMGGDPGAVRGGWPAGAWQLLSQVDAGPGLPKLRVWAAQFVDAAVRDLVLSNDEHGSIDAHSHLYFVSGVRPGTDIAEVFFPGAVASSTGATAQPLPLYNPDTSGLLIGAWMSGALLNYSSLGGPTAQAELDSTSSTSRTGEQTLSAYGPATRTATASAAAPWVAASIVVRADPGGSVTFPAAPLRMRAELALGADPGADPAAWAGLWTDITADAQPRDGGVSITRGRADETSTVNPSSMTLTLNNSSGRYVRLNPNGPYYGRLGKNTPIQLWADYGRGWTLRYRGFVSEFPPRSLGGQADEHMPITAAGPTRRLARGRVLASPLRKAITTRGAANAYWPLESDGASGLLDGPVMRTRGAISFGDGGPDGSAGGLSAPFGSSAYSTVPGMPATGSWQVSWWVEQDAGATDITPVVSWLTPNAVWARWFGYVSAGQVVVESVQQFSVTVVQVLGATDIRGMGAVQVTVRAYPFGSDVAFSLYVNGSPDGGDTVTSDSPQPVTALGINNLNFGTSHDITGTISHLWTKSTDPAQTTTDFLASMEWLLIAGGGYAGERACDRIRRVSTEEGVPLAIVGNDGASEPMGPQPTARFLDVLRDCEDTDGGVLFERRDGRLAYQARAARYNAIPAMTLDYSAGHVAMPFEPLDDDQHLVNDFTASRDDGGSSRVVDQDHKEASGEYADSVTVNAASDDQLPHMAGWRVHLGTADDLRYPVITPNLLARPVLLPDWAALDVGQAMAITNPGRDLPPGQIDVIAEGYTEVLDTVSWTASVNCSPGKPWQVVVLDDDVLGRLDTAGAALNSGITSSATSMSVKTLSGPLWSTDAADRPFDVVVSGEVMTVTNVTGSSSPQTFTVTRSVNGIVKAHSANEPVVLAQSPILAQ